MNIRISHAAMHWMVAAIVLCFVGQVHAQRDSYQSEAKIAYYGKLSDGLAEAKRSGRPIFLVAAAPQCEGVPGIW